MAQIAQPTILRTLVLTLVPQAKNLVDINIFDIDYLPQINYGF